MEAGSYSKFLDNFGSEIGTTLEDLATTWGESEYDFADDNPAVMKDSRSSSFQSRNSMDSIAGISDWSLKKARPLAFTNPVYHLLTANKVASNPRQMKLIPLSQFEINKNHDDSTKKSKKGLMNKLSSLSIRRSNSMKKSEPEMQVTAPLWTDAPTVIPSEPRVRSRSLLPHKKNERYQEIEEESEVAKTEEKVRPAKLDLTAAKNSSEALKPPPIKTPRTAKGSYSPLEPPSETFKNNEKEVTTDSLGKSEDQNQSEPKSSDVTEEPLADDHTTKTMMEVMNEIDDDSAQSEKQPTLDPPTQRSGDDEAEDDGEPRLKRNKTVKWSGSRAAPALIREFTRKSRKQSRQIEVAATESPDLSSTESPVKSLNTEEVIKPRSAVSPVPKKRDSSAFTVLSSLLPPAPKLRRSESTKIRAYIHKMGTNQHNALGYATTEFVKQTMQSMEYRPVVILHSIRSFLTDIKKYLISNPHVGFMTKIQKITKAMPMSDVEGAIDDALERLVLYPLRDHIYKRLVLSYAHTGKIKMVEDAIRIGQTKSSRELGIRETLIPPDDEAMELIQQHFRSLQATFSPYYKLKHLLSAVTTIYENTSDKTCDDKSARKIGADDFLPLLVNAIIKCNFAAADIEAQYIDGLLDPTLLLGEGGYYLTTLISAVQVLLSIKKRETPLPNVTDLQGFLKVGISSKIDDGNSVMIHKTLHVPPSMSANNLGLMIAKKFGIKQNKNYGLHVVVNGVAYPLRPQEFPQLVKMDLLTQFSPGSFFFVYRLLEKTPNASDERPTTFDSQKLKVNTEEGDDSSVAAEMEESPTNDTKDAANSQKSSMTLDLPPNNESVPDEAQSPGFSDIPLPDDIMITADQNGGSPDNTIPPTSHEAHLPSPPIQDFPPDDIMITAHQNGESPSNTLPPTSYEADLPSPPIEDFSSGVLSPETKSGPSSDTPPLTPQETDLPPPPIQDPDPNDIINPETPPTDDITSPDAIISDVTIAETEQMNVQTNEISDVTDDVTMQENMAASDNDVTMTSQAEDLTDDSTVQTTERPVDIGIAQQDEPVSDEIKDLSETTCCEVTMPDSVPPEIAEQPGDKNLPKEIIEAEVIITPPDPMHPPPDEVPIPFDLSDEQLPPPPEDLSTLPDVNIVPSEVATEPAEQYPEGANLSPGPLSHGGDTSDGEFLSDDDLLAEESYLQGTMVDDFMSPIKKLSPAAKAKKKATLPPSIEEDTTVKGEDAFKSDEARPDSSLSNTSGDSGHRRGYHSNGNLDDPKQMDPCSLTSVSALKTYFESEIHKVRKHSPNKDTSK